MQIHVARPFRAGALKQVRRPDPGRRPGLIPQGGTPLWGSKVQSPDADRKRSAPAKERTQGDSTDSPLVPLSRMLENPPRLSFRGVPI
jgi:hypothetical protein